MAYDEIAAMEAAAWERACASHDQLPEYGGDAGVFSAPGAYDDDFDPTPRAGKYWGEKVGTIVRKASRDHEYWYLGGGDGPDPIECALLDLREAITELEAIKSHRHDWNDDDYCNICGADGRA